MPTLQFSTFSLAFPCPHTRKVGTWLDSSLRSGSHSVPGFKLVVVITVWGVRLTGCERDSRYHHNNNWPNLAWPVFPPEGNITTTTRQLTNSPTFGQVLYAYFLLGMRPTGLDGNLRIIIFSLGVRFLCRERPPTRLSNYLSLTYFLGGMGKS